MEKNPISGGANPTKTETIDETEDNTQVGQTGSTPTLVLRLEQPRDERRVIFHDGVIDNEHMNRKKSKCCCIYKKPLAFGESSSDDDEECEHCFGHPEKRKKNRKGHHNEYDHDYDHDDASCSLVRRGDERSTSVHTPETEMPLTDAIPPIEKLNTSENPTESSSS